MPQRSRFKTEAAYRKALDHSNQCNKMRRKLIKKHGAAYMKDKDAAHTGVGTAKAVSRKVNQGKGRKKKGVAKYDPKGPSDVKVAL